MSQMIQKNLLSVVLFLFMVVAMTGCTTTSEDVKTIDLPYKEFKNLISVASCSGPSGSYTTEVHSTNDGYTFFQQDYGDRGVYTAAISGNQGYSYDSANQVTDTLSIESISIIVGHEFHKIHMFPEKFFQAITYEKDIKFNQKQCEQFGSKDMLGYPVNLFYNRSASQLEGLTIKNPMDTTEQIQITYKSWLNTPLGQLAKKVEIIQGGSDTYVFEYDGFTIDKLGLKRFL